MHATPRQCARPARPARYRLSRPLVLLVLAGLVACSDPPTAEPTPPPLPVSMITVTPDSVVIAPGASQTFRMNLFGPGGESLANRTTRWSTSDTAVASVDSISGVATAQGEGHALISARSEGVTGTSSLTVRIPVGAIRLSPDGAIVSVGSQQAFSATVLGPDGDVLVNRTVQWSTSDSTVAAVDVVSGLVTGLREGSATITASVEGTSATAPVVVGESVTIHARSSTGGTISPASQVVGRGDSAVFTITPDPGYTASWIDGCDGALRYTQYHTRAVIAPCALDVTFRRLRPGGTRAYMAHFYFPEAGPTSVPFSAAETRGFVEGGMFPLTQFMDRVSNQAVLLDPDYSNLLPLDHPRDSFIAEDSTGFSLQRHALEVLGRHIDFRQYEIVVLMFPPLEFGAPGCRGNLRPIAVEEGDELVPIRLTMLAGNQFGCYSPLFMSHELGHNYGLGHSGLIRCSSAPTDPSDVLDPMWCGTGIGATYFETGDGYDVMGSYRGDPNIIWKVQAGWIDADDIILLDRSTRVTLAPADTAANGVRGARIPLHVAADGSEVSYWVEYRTLPIRDLATGNAVPTNQVQIRRNMPSLVDQGGNLRGAVTLLDTTLTQTDQSFHDAYAGVRVRWHAVEGFGPASSRAVVDVDISPIVIAQSVAGDEHTLTFASSATTPITVHRLVTAGRDAASFIVLHDACTGRTLASGSSCVVRVRSPGGAFGRGSVIFENSDTLRPQAAVSLTTLR